jgi:hypothetical protein
MNEPKANEDWLQLEQDIARLFSAAPLPAPNYFSKEELFAGRSSEVGRLIEAVRDPAKHILLYGERGTGKTSISNNFWPKRHKSDQPTIIARIQAFPSDDFSSLWLKVLRELKIAAQNYSKELRADFESVSPDILKHEFQKLHKNWISIIIVDEFDRLRSEQAREITANFLKSLHDDGINVTILLIGVADNVEELIANHQSLRRVLSLVKLERMSALGLNEILNKRLQLTPISFATDARSIIIGLSCGLPYYVQTLGKFAAQNAIEGRRIRVCLEDVKVAIGKFIVESSESFDEIYQRATESRQLGNIFEEVILAAALAPSDTNGFFRSSDVLKVLKLMFIDEKLSYPRIQRYLSLFKTHRRGKILYRKNNVTNDCYRFTDSTMQPFIIMRAIEIGGDVQFLLSYWNKQDVRDWEYQPYTVEANASQGQPMMRGESDPQEISTDFVEQPIEATIIPTAIENVSEEGLVPRASGPRLRSARPPRKSILRGFLSISK